ncbi:DUF885 domain-containing protein [Allosphingosinicella indica]|uniref:DUF885 domain-containing protein n=1 Tax=Allosphingosinicella indica TaxID=941907 RepID=UPI000A14D93B|nr:DUF885 domain-containing protein [Allosphingosinicella indica]
MKQLSIAALLLATTACATAPQGASVAGAPPSATATQPAADPAAEDARLLAFLDKGFDEMVARSPESLTALGSKERYGELDDYTDAEAQRQRAMADAQLAAMKSQFTLEGLSPAGQLSYRLYEQQVTNGRENFEWRRYGFPVSTNGSPAGDIPVLLINQHRIDSVADAEAYVSRLKAVDRVMREVADEMRGQARMGIVPPKLNFAPVRADAKKIVTGAPFDKGADSALFADFKTKVGKLDAPAAEKERLIGEARTALTGPFRQGYQTFFSVLDEIEPQAKGNDGVWSLPRGDEYYANRLRMFTTTDLTADQIHQIGLDEVKRIQGEMEAIKQRVGFKGTLQQFFQHIKTGKQFKYPNSEAGRQQYLTDAKAFIAQVMDKAPQWFERLPKAPLEVRAVEKFREGTASVAFYNRPAPDGSRPGIYYVNLADMTQVLKPQIEGISYHEGAPGHHFQLARQMELTGIPKFRLFGGYGAYVEGWGLYAERLGKEMGFYQNPYSEFGHLSLELWRAVRLVTDTGLHSKRWSRERAIQYFQQNSLLSEADIVREVERYINWPGQATSYKIGQLKIIELRRKAEAALGDRFDIRAFHEAVLGQGALPLDVLEQEVDAYIARAKG